MDKEIRKLEVRRKELKARISKLEGQIRVMRDRIEGVKKFSKLLQRQLGERSMKLLTA